MGDQSKFRRRNFPGQLAQRDDQTDTGTCVRFAISKAIANNLHVQKRIDVNQSEITRVLIQKTGMACGIRRIGPNDLIGKFDKMNLILQDVDNLINGHGPRCWWEVIFIYSN